MKVKYYRLSQFAEFDSAYWGMGTQSGLIYFALCTHQPGKSAGLFSYNPKTKKILQIATVTEMLNSKKPEQIQGKIHTPLFEGSDGNFYFGTHFSYPFGKPQKITYEGGHLIKYNPLNNTFEDLGIPLKNEGIVTMTLDKKRMVAYMLMAPSGDFISYNLDKKKFINFGSVINGGSICRSLVVDDQGNVFGSFEPNGIFCYNFKEKTVTTSKLTLPNASYHVDEWTGPSRGGVNKIGRNIWRGVLWNQKTKNIFSVHAATSHLIQIDPKKEKIEDQKFFAAKKFINNENKIYPTLSLTSVKDTIFYAPAGGLFDYERSENITEWTHLITYDISTKKVTDHGELRDGNSRMFGIGGAVAKTKNNLFFLGAVEKSDSKTYNNQYDLQKRGFDLALIEITNL